MTHIYSLAGHWSRTLLRKLAGVIISAISFVALTGPAGSAEQSRFVALDYEVHLNGILVATLAVDAELKAGGYRLLSNMETHDIMDLLLGFRSKAHARGETNKGQVIPQFHSDKNIWMEEARHVRIKYGSDGPREVDVSPLPATEGRDEVSRELRAGTLDLMSAALQMSLWAQQGTICESQAQVFDGRRRYDLKFSAGKVEDTSIGSQINCSGELDRLAGKSAKSWLPRSSAPKQFQIWLTRIAPDLPPVPSRLRAFGGIGWLVAQLREHSRERRSDAPGSDSE